MVAGKAPRWNSCSRLTTVWLFSIYSNGALGLCRRNAGDRFAALLFIHLREGKGGSNGRRVGSKTICVFLHLNKTW